MEQGELSETIASVTQGSDGAGDETTLAQLLDSLGDRLERTLGGRLDQLERMILSLRMQGEGGVHSLRGRTSSVDRRGPPRLGVVDRRHPAKDGANLPGTLKALDNSSPERAVDDVDSPKLERARGRAGLNDRAGAHGVPVGIINASWRWPLDFGALTAGLGYEDARSAAQKWRANVRVHKSSGSAPLKALEESSSKEAPSTTLPRSPLNGEDSTSSMAFSGETWKEPAEPSPDASQSAFEVAGFELSPHEMSPFCRRGISESELSVSSCGPSTVVNVQFVLLEVWAKGEVSNKNVAEHVWARSARRCTESNLVMPNMQGLDEAVPWWLTRPSSPRRLVWDMISMVLILYDIIVIPVQLAFETGENGIFAAINLMTLFFWTLDIFFTFLCGVYNRGDEELRLMHIALNYLRTWFVMDVAVVGSEWVWLSGLSRSQSRGIALARLGKSVRILRLLRLWRMRETMGKFQDRITSEYIHIVLRVAKLIVLILGVNHFLACIWYALGTHLFDEESASWVEAGEFAHENLAYRYLTSFHWSITQFTPASMEVVPTSWPERLFCVCVIVLGLVMFSSFISSITAAMTQLQQLSGLFDKNLSVLRRYLRDREISGDLTMRILRFVEHQQSRAAKEVRERDVVLLGSLSRPLYMEMMRQVYAPVLATHPMLSYFGDLGEDSALHQLCNQAVTHFQHSTGDVLFTGGTGGHHMYFLRKGAMRYALGGVVSPPPTADGWRQPMSPVPTGKRISNGKLLGAVKSLLYVPRDPSARSMVSPLASNNTKDEAGAMSPTTPSQIAGDSLDNTLLQEVGAHCCEAALWTNWVHLGTMHIVASTEIISLSASGFADVMVKHRRMFHDVCHYGYLFIERMNAFMAKQPATDLPIFSKQELADEAFLTTLKRDRVGRASKQRSRTSIFHTSSRSAVSKIRDWVHEERRNNDSVDPDWAAHIDDELALRHVWSEP